MQDFRTLQVWQKAHEMALATYKATQTFPRQEVYGLVTQLRGSASSVPANIAEGCGCNGNREFARFLEIAFRSASETEYYLLLAKDLGYLEVKTHESLSHQITQVKRMLMGLIQKLKTDNR